MRILSLYDGISCGQQALKELGIYITEYYACEIDPYAIAIAQKNFPNTIQLGDVFDVDFSKLGHFDLVIGGSPCTHWSIAKKGRETTSEGVGFDLFMRFVHAVRETKATYFLYENNFSIHQDIKDAITEQFGVEHIMIDSALVSAQRRRRCYWSNLPTQGQPDNLNIVLKDVLEQDVDPKYNVSETSLARYFKVDKPKGFKTEAEKGAALTATMYKGYGNDGVTLVKVDSPIRLGDIGTTAQAHRVYSPEGKSVNLTAQGGGQGAKTGLYHTGDTVRRLTPLECERLQTLLDGFTETGIFNGVEKPISDSQRYKTLGNGWTVSVIKHLMKGLSNANTR